jgi:thioredoxin-related protein
MLHLSTARFSMSILARLLTLVLLAATCAATDLTLTAIDGTTHTPLIAKDGKPALFFFVSPFCSTTKAFVKEMNQITADHAGKVSVFVIECDPEVTRDVAIEHATLSEFKAPVLLDATQELTRRLQAAVTPETVLVDATGKVFYRGRINDLYLGPTKRQRAATTNDLREAITALLAGKPAPQPQEPAQGCKIGGIK